MNGGDTIALGGLIRETDSVTQSGVPWLRRIPVFGAAFGRKSTTVRRTELVVFLTPRVITTSTELDDVMRELRQSFDGIEGSLLFD